MSGDIAVVLALGDEGKDLLFSGSQFGKGVGRGFGPGLVEEGNESASDGGTEDGLVLSDGPDGTQNVGFLGIFEDVATRACTHGGEDGIVVLEHGDDEDADVRTGVDDLTDGFDTVDARHLDIHKYDVGLQFSGKGDGFLSTGCFTDELEVRLTTHEGGEPMTEERVVVNDDDP